MGLLDDAIREHLDLKRRRGADPAEVERAEREALGPVRRGPEEPEATDEQLEQALPHDAAPAAPYDDEEPDWRESFDDTEHPIAYEEPFGDTEHPIAYEEPLAETNDPGHSSDTHEPPTADGRSLIEEQPTRHMRPEPAGAPGAYEPFDDSNEPLEEPEPHDAFGHPPDAVMPRPRPAPATPAPAGAQPPPAGQPAGGETVEYEVEAALEAEERKAKDDVLEETPEFLQDTPDHDRLWFEQRPPKDFDFEG